MAACTLLVINESTHTLLHGGSGANSAKTAVSRERFSVESTREEAIETPSQAASPSQGTPTDGRFIAASDDCVSQAK